MTVLGGIDPGFYLSAGTAASRGYLHHRWSDDLDLFVNDDPRFGLWALGDPTVAATYELCIFDRAGGVPSIAASARVPAGGLWRATASGFKYTDKAAAHGGVKSMSLKTNGAGRTSISAMAKGVALATPALPLQQDPDVLVQLSNGGACWEAAFSVPSKNDPAGFKAKSD